MSGLTWSLILAASVLGENRTYGDAHAQAQSQGKPLLVLVGAEWCPGCRTLKHQTMPRLVRSGKLSGVEFAVVDSDQEPALARRLMRGNSIPQLILFTRTAEGWKRGQLTGAQAERTIESFLQAATAEHVAQQVVPAGATESAGAREGGETDAGGR